MKRLSIFIFLIIPYFGFSQFFWSQQIDNIAPTASVDEATIFNTTGATVEVTTNERGVIYLVKDDVAVSIAAFEAAILDNKANKTTATTTGGGTFEVDAEQLDAGEYVGYAVDDFQNLSSRSINSVTIVGVSELSVNEVRTDADPAGIGYIQIDGEVTQEKVSPLGFYLQDDTGAQTGIWVSDIADEANVSRGSAVLILAQVKESGTHVYLEFHSVIEYIADVFTVNPIEIDSTDIITGNYRDVLSKITDFTAGATTAGKTPFDDGTGIVYVDDLFYAATFTNGNNYNVIGVGEYDGSDYIIAPRDAADVSTP